MKEYALTLAALGWKPIPLSWDATSKTGRPIISHESINATTDVSQYWKQDAQGMGLKLFPPFFMIDFDLKNTDNKELFREWLLALDATQPGIISKVCIEETRNGGYHVYGMSSKVKNKVVLAASVTGAEVVSIYTNSVLSYTWPTPGYDIVQNDMESIEMLTDEESDHLFSLCASFNEYTDRTSTAKICITYPEQYMEQCKAFDAGIPDETFEQLLNDMTLYEVKDYRYRTKDKYLAYLRKGSSAAFSAKVYWKTRKVLLFTTSLPQYPSHNDYIPERPGEWILTPAKIVYYRNGGNWQQAMDELQMIADAIGLELPQLKQPVTNEFPFHVLPEYLQYSIREVAFHRSLPEHFVATACLWGVASLAGNSYINQKLPSTENILFVLMIAPVSVGKTPSVKAAVFDPLKRIMAQDELQYRQVLEQWTQDKVNAANKKKAFAEPRPKRYMPLAMDGTTEAFVAIHMDQPNGIGVYYDEAETLFNAGNYKAINDAVTFYTTCFNGGPLNQSRAEREKERVVPDVNINLMAGTQPERVANIFTQDKIQSGFPARFLMVYSDYKQLNEDSDPFAEGVSMCREWQDLLQCLYNFGKEHNKSNVVRYVTMTPDAMDIYRHYHREGLQQANDRISRREHPVLIGLGAKMSAYLMRITQVLAIIHDCDNPCITAEIMQAGHQLYNYYYQSTADMLMRSQTEAETGLPTELERLYQKLPDEKFTLAQARLICAELRISERKFELSLRNKKFKELFAKVGHGTYIKN